MKNEINPKGELKETFLAACQISDMEQRKVYLAKECGEEAGMLQRILKMLEAEQSQKPSALERMRDIVNVETMDLAQLNDTQPLDIDSCPPIGPYKLLEQIGEGGMGVVYLALQEKPIRRKVALKIIKPGMDSRQVIARFEAERQALAMMNHPHIAKVLDAGSTESGRPYFVMELVKGIPITQFCDQHKLDIRKRLELFVKVCEAVQHAHQKGIIHRDLKPFNILVELVNVTPVPKVIDFGIAKATNQQLTDHTLHTGFSQMIGTPQYMSPEQADLNGMDVDTRSDIYSLGVVLYVLLTGTTPLDLESLKKAGFDEVRRMIREVDPASPSLRLSTLKNNVASTVIDSRQVDYRQLMRSMKSELDWIVMKAIEKDRTRRYETAQAMADDVQRFLDGEEVEACPPSVHYRLSKLIRRNKAPFIVASLVVLGLVATSLLSTMLVYQERKLTEQRGQIQLGITGALTRVAQLRTATSENFSKDLLSKAIDELSIAKSLALTGLVDAQARDQIEQFSLELEQERKDQKLIEDLKFDAVNPNNETLKLDSFVSHTKSSLLEYGIEFGKSNPHQIANQLITRPPRVREAVIGVFSLLRKTLLPPLGFSYRQNDGRVFVSDYYKSQSLRSNDELICIDDKEVQNLSLWEIHQLLCGESGSHIHLKIIRSGSTTSEIVSVERDRDAVWLKTIVDSIDPYPELIEFRSILESNDLQLITKESKRLADDSFDLRSLYHSSAVVNALIRVRDYDRAEAMLGKLLKAFPKSGGFYANLGEVSIRQQRFEEAARFYSVAVALDPKQSLNHYKLGDAFKRMGKMDPAIDEFRECVRLEGNGPKARQYIADILRDQGKLDEAIVEYRELIRLNPKEVIAHVHLGLALTFQGDHVAALEMLHESIRLQPDNVVAYLNKARILGLQNKPADAEDALRTALRIARKGVPLLNNLIYHLAKNGKIEEAVMMGKQFADAWPGLAMPHFALGFSLYCQGDLHQAKDAYSRGFRIDPNAESDYEDYGKVLQELGQFDDAIAAFRKTWNSRLSQFPLRKLELTSIEQELLNEAFDEFCKTLRDQSDSKGLQLYRSRGMAFNKIGKYQDAIFDLLQAIDGDPRDVHSLGLLASIWSGQNRFDFALASQTQIIGIETSKNYHYFQRAEYYRATGRFDLALSDIEQGLKVDPLTDSASFPRSRAFALRGDIYADDLKDFDRAQEAYDRAVELAPQEESYSFKQNALREKH